MKKLILIAGLLLVVGCSSTNYESTMDEYSKTYYNNHMSMTSAKTVYITKNMLIEASDEDGYDMSKLDACTNDSKIVYTIEDKKISNIEYFLDCK